MASARVNLLRSAENGRPIARIGAMERDAAGYVAVAPTLFGSTGSTMEVIGAVERGMPPRRVRAIAQSTQMLQTAQVESHTDASEENEKLPDRFRRLSGSLIRTSRFLRDESIAAVGVDGIQGRLESAAALLKV